MKSAYLLAIAALAMATGQAIQPASAQDWQPSRPVTLVVPFPAGGGNDALARLVAERMSKTLGQQVVVENRGGAGGTVATRAIAKTPPDGHTILLSYTGTFAINPTLYPNAGYDPRKDFAPIGTIGTLTSILVSHPSLPVKSTADLIDYARKNPGKINYGFVPGTVGHISTEMFARSAAIKLTNIPYKGNGNAIADLMGGHVSMMFLSILPVIGQIQAGTLHALAVASPARSSLVPNVPTIAEFGRARLLGRHQLRAGGASGHAARDRDAAEQGAADSTRRHDAAQAARCRRRRGAAGDAGGLRQDDRR